jgi:hypothetical protein
MRSAADISRRFVRVIHHHIILDLHTEIKKALAEQKLASSKAVHASVDAG